MIPKFAGATTESMLGLLWDVTKEHPELVEFWMTCTSAEQVEIAKHILLYAQAVVRFQKAWQEAHNSEQRTKP